MVWYLILKIWAKELLHILYSYARKSQYDKLQRSQLQSNCSNEKPPYQQLVCSIILAWQVTDTWQYKAFNRKASLYTVSLALSSGFVNSLLGEVTLELSMLSVDIIFLAHIDVGIWLLVPNCTVHYYFHIGWSSPWTDLIYER